MLALLKPWRNMEMLKKDEETFENAFSSFMSTATEQVQSIVMNIQYFHDCTDQAKREDEKSRLTRNYSYAVVPPGEHLDDTYDESEDSGIRSTEESSSVESCISDEDLLHACEGTVTTREMVYTEVAMNIADEYNFFEVAQASTPSIHTASIVTDQDLQHCLEWQRYIAEADSPSKETHDTEITAGNVMITPASLSVRPSAHPEGTSTIPSKQSPFDPPSHLNKEQSMAFTIVTEHIYRILIGENPPQLLMIIHGPGGTGKTCLLKAITRMFTDIGITERFAKTALSGVAACQIGGKTLHSWGTLPAGKGIPRTDKWIYRPSAQTAHRRRLNMQDTLLLGGDEMSLLTTDTLYLLSQVVSAFRLANTVPRTMPDAPFAGLSVLLSGDFHQFPPVAGRNRALYSQHPTTSKCELGQNIYTQFNTVVNLTQQVRITDSVWLDILGRARVGACTSEDLSEIQRLVLTMEDCPVPNFAVAPWMHAVLITPRNSVQIRWNNRATEKYSALSGEMMFICPAEDSAHGQPLNARQTLIVAQMPLKETEQLPTMLRLVRGMQVMVTRNLATTANLSNGSRGRVVDIKLDVREDRIADEAFAAHKVFLRYPPALIILELDFCQLSPLPGLSERQVPLTPEKFKFTIGSSPSTTITRRQLPLTPAYAFTDFKSQGQTIEHVLVDIGRTTCFNLSPFNAYVALSRSRGRETIRLLRDFDNELFLRHPSEDLRVEETRIDALVEQTKKDFDNTHR
jgi:hypothetical protein